jgi:transglutaminase-like putative cysteine protease
MTSLTEDPRYLAPADFIDSAHPAVIAFAGEKSAGSGSPRQQILSLYYAVRDEILYDPYLPMQDRSSYRASHCLLAGRGWCVSKAALLAACARARGVPARCGYADVRNHLATPKLLESMGTDVFYWHSYADLYLDGQWLKATPAFNRSLCEKFGLRPLDFDGRQDSLFQEFDQAGNRHMEYLRFRGTFGDVPYDEIIATFASEYGESSLGAGISGDFQAEAGSG